jgi:hypothetical protein
MGLIMAEGKELLESVFDVPFSFRERPISVPPELRPIWRIPSLLLILDKCRGKKATWPQLHVMNWALRSPYSREIFLGLIDQRVGTEKAIVRYEPSLNRAIDLAVGASLATWDHQGNLKLSDKGMKLLEEVFKSESLFIEEREFLEKIDGKVTQTLINRILAWKSPQ